MKICEVNQGITKHKQPNRKGRGKGSGQGKTGGRGHKGQGQRNGWSALSIFQGGTMPLVRRIPKRGFHNAFAVNVATINIRDLEEKFQSGAEVTVEAVRALHLARGRFDQLKILGEGELTKKLTVSAHRFSESAREKIEKAGGKVNVVVAITPVEVKKRAAAKERAAAANGKTAKAKTAKEK